VVFKHYGDVTSVGIKLQGSKVAYGLPENKLEFELRAQNVSARKETLRASLK